MLWYWFLMIPICYADPSILLIGGFGSNGKIEKFDPNTMTSEIITRHGDGLLLGSHDSAGPVNDTHAIVYAMESGTFFIDIKGNISSGPETRLAEIASLCDANGRRQVVSCSYRGKRCKVLSEDGGSFEEHSTMTTLVRVFTLTSFGKELIAVGKRSRLEGVAERYDGIKWKKIQTPPSDRSCTAAVKLNDDQLLSCGCEDRKTACYVYNLGSDEWVDGPEANSTVWYSKLAMVGQTVYAFGGVDDGRAIQTLDVSNGIDKAEWKLESARLKVGHVMFGIWVVDELDVCPITTTGEPTTGTTSGSMETDGAVTDGQGLGDSTTVTTSGSMVTGGHLLGMILMALLVFTYSRIEN